MLALVEAEVEGYSSCEQLAGSPLGMLQILVRAVILHRGRFQGNYLLLLLLLRRKTHRDQLEATKRDVAHQNQRMLVHE